MIDRSGGILVPVDFRNDLGEYEVGMAIASGDPDRPHFEPIPDPLPEMLPTIQEPIRTIREATRVADGIAFALVTREGILQRLEIERSDDASEDTERHEGAHP